MAAENWCVGFRDFTQYATYSGGVAADSSGNIFFGIDGLIVKLNKYGKVLKVAQSPNKTFSSVANLYIGSDGYLYVTGINNASDSVVVAKMSTSTLALQWSRKLDHSYGGSEYGLSIRTDSNGNVVAVGVCYVAVSNTDGLVAQYSASGSIQWKRLYAVTASGDQTNGLAIDSSNNIYVGFTGTITRANAIIAKYNSSGVLQWHRKVTHATYGVSGRYESICLDDSGNVYATLGSTQNIGLICKWNSSGVLQWQKYLTAGNFISSLVWDSASSAIYGVGGNFVIKLDTSGAVTWSRSITNSLVTTTLIHITTSGSNIIVGGNCGFLYKLKMDGTGTGTYGAFTYGTLSLATNTSTYTESAATFSEAAATAVTDAEASATESTFGYYSVRE